MAYHGPHACSGSRESPPCVLQLSFIDHANQAGEKLRSAHAEGKPNAMHSPVGGPEGGGSVAGGGSMSEDSIDSPFASGVSSSAGMVNGVA